MRRRCILFLCLGIGLVGGVFWGCGSAPAQLPQNRPAAVPRNVTDRAAATPSSPFDSAAARVVQEARSLLATPYRYAGSDPKGFDCSGLTAYVFERVGLRLPRTAAAQALAGRWVAPDELTSGDLVFFGEDRTALHHVGVVISRAGDPLTMIHSSSSRGVVETAILTNSYWLRRLRFGRRVLDGD